MTQHPPIGWGFQDFTTEFASLFCEPSQRQYCAVLSTFLPASFNVYFEIDNITEHFDVHCFGIFSKPRALETDFGGA